MNKTIFSQKVDQLLALVKLAEKFGEVTSRKMSKQQWVVFYSTSPDKAELLLIRYMTEAYVVLSSNFPNKDQLIARPTKGDKGESIRGEKGDTGKKGEDGKDAPQMDEIESVLKKMVEAIEVPVPEVPEPKVQQLTQTVYETIDFDVDKELTRSGHAVRDALELIEEEEQKLAQSAVRGLPKRLRAIDTQIAELIEEIRKKGNSAGAEWVGTTWEEAEQIATKVVNNLVAGAQTTFETINKNLLAYDVTDTTETASQITITYDGPDGAIIKTVAFDANGDPITITLSGATPASIDLVKTFDFTGRDIPLITYS